jgi:hypothetical protein
LIYQVQLSQPQERPAMADNNEHIESLELQIAHLQGMVAHLLLRNQQLRDRTAPFTRSAISRPGSGDSCVIIQRSFPKYYEGHMQTGLSEE